MKMKVSGTKFINVKLQLHLIRVIKLHLKVLDKMALKTYKPLQDFVKRPWYEIFETDIAWRNVIIFIILHGLGLYAAHYLIVNRRPDIYITGELVVLLVIGSN